MTQLQQQPALPATGEDGQGGTYEVTPAKRVTSEILSEMEGANQAEKKDKDGVQATRL